MFKKDYFNLPILWLGLFSACGYFARLTIASLSFVCSIILRRYYNAQLAFSTKARLRTGLRFFRLWVFRLCLAGVAKQPQLSYGGYQQLRPKLIVLVFTLAYAFFRLPHNYWAYAQVIYRSQNEKRFFCTRTYNNQSSLCSDTVSQTPKLHASAFSAHTLCLSRFFLTPSE